MAKGDIIDYLIGLRVPALDVLIDRWLADRRVAEERAFTRGWLDGSDCVPFSAERTREALDG